MTKLTEAQTFNRPKYQTEAVSCIVIKDGVAHQTAWMGCTAYSGAMAQDATTGGKQQPSGCAVRRATHDAIGGTTIPQVADALFNLYRANILRYTGSSVITPQRLAAYIRAGRKTMVQGNADALIGTPFRSTAGAVNHCVEINEVRGGTVDEPHEALVYDPAANGRKVGWGTADQGPSWWPWSLVKKFCAYLRPAGDGTARLGPGKVYCGVFIDSEPHFTPISGATKAHPFPDRVRAHDPNDPVTSIHRTSDGKVIYTVKNGTLLRLYQYKAGRGYNDDGTEWVLLSNLSHVGGAT